MSKKHDFLRSEQSRDKHPESNMAGSASHVQGRSPKAASADKQPAHTPKSSNDHNKMGDTHPTQTNEGRRTPQSRHDRQSLNGSMNVVQARTGGKGAGRGSVGGKSS